MKYAALLLNALTALLLCWGLYGAAKSADTRAAPQRTVAPALPPISADAQAGQNRVAEALDAMMRLADREEAHADRLLALPPPGSDLAGSVQMPARSFTLHIEDLGSNTQSVVIDGHLARSGDHLGDGAHVVRIRPAEAVVSEKAGHQTLSMPLGELRVGTLRRAGSSSAEEVSVRRFHTGLPDSPAAVIGNSP